MTELTNMATLERQRTVIKRPNAHKVSALGSDVPVQFSGYLKKETHTGGGGGGGYRRFRSAKTWLTRWYELRGATLVYYLKKPSAKGDAGSSSSSSSSNTLPAGIIDLHEIQSVSVDASTGGADVLVLQSSSHFYRFRASDNTLLEKWHEMFLSRVAELQCPDFVGTLRALYMAYNPQLMSKVPAVALRFSNRQTELIGAIHAKYSDDYAEGRSVDDATQTRIMEMESLERGDARHRARSGSPMYSGAKFTRAYAVGDKVEAMYKYRGDFRPATIVGTAQSDYLLYDVQFEGDGNEVQPKTVVSRIRPAPNDIERQDADIASVDRQDAGIASVERQDADIPGVANPIVASSEGEGQDAEARESVDPASEEALDGDAIAANELNIANLKDAQEAALTSAVSALGEGFYTICVAKVFSKGSKKTPLAFKFFWVFCSVLLFTGQLCVAMSLITDVVMPTCKTQDDCEYQGYMCMNFHGLDIKRFTGPVCMECRDILANYNLYCKQELKGKKASSLENYGPFYNKRNEHNKRNKHMLSDDGWLDDGRTKKEMKQSARSGEWSNGFPYVPKASGLDTTAIDYCFNEVDYARGNTCHVYSAQKKALKLGNMFVLFVVSLLIGLTVMGEKQQATFMDILFHIKASDSFIDLEGIIKWCWASCRAATPVPVKGNTSSPSTWTRNKKEKAIVAVMWAINIMRIRVLIPMVITTVVALVGFQGSSSVDIVLNGLATVFILDLDDTIGQTLFSEARRAEATDFFKEEFKKMIDEDNAKGQTKDGPVFKYHSKRFLVETKLDRFTCQLSIFITLGIIAVCLYSVWPHESCARIMFNWVFYVYVINGSLQVFEQVARAASQQIEDWEKHELDPELKAKSFWTKVVIFVQSAGLDMLKQFGWGCLYTIISGCYIAQRLLLLWLMIRGGTGMSMIATGKATMTQAFVAWGLGQPNFYFWGDDEKQPYRHESPPYELYGKPPLIYCEDYEHNDDH